MDLLSNRLWSGADPKNKIHKKETASTVIQSLVFAQAAALARKGQLIQSEELLTALIKDGNYSIEAIHLLARIYAQQGLIEEAKTLWKRALELDPLNKEFSRALKRCSRMQNRSLYRFQISFLTPILLICLFASIAVAYTVSRWGEITQNNALSNASTPITTGQDTAAAEREHILPTPIMTNYTIDTIDLDRTFLPAQNDTNPLAENPDIIEQEPTMHDSGSISDTNWEEPPYIPTTEYEIQIAEPVVEEPTPETEKSEPDPTALQDQITQALQSHETLGSYDLTVTQSDSIVQIKGEVLNLQMRYLVEETVRSVTGVNFVDLSGVTLAGTYIVQPGDTLSDIALKVYGKRIHLRQLMEVNKLPSPNIIHRGQKLIIPR